MISVASLWTQFFPPRPKFTEGDVADLNGKVYIVTGATSGLGKEVARILYSKHATVYLGTRNETKTIEVIDHIKKVAPSSTGIIRHFHLDLGDLSSVKASAEQFLAAEKQLHVLFNNAGYMGPEGGTERTMQGHEKHLAINCLGTFLLTKLLTPTLTATAAAPGIPAGSVRVVYLSSIAAEMYSDKNVGLRLDNLDYHAEKSSKYRYGVSKLGNWAYALELSKRLRNDGVIGVAINPGNLQTDLFRHQSYLFRLLTGPANYPIINGAYAELWAGLSPEITPEKAGEYAVPFGRFHPIRRDLEQNAARSEAEGGNGATSKFWDWSEKQVKQYL
ncbi:hypothetical protein S40288_03868 [Stachybotrys chartarum IBT 40288]|nr:hypothetical protein S40288_03868 [Stachybotrys chartarum IBT 40288]